MDRRRLIRGAGVVGALAAAPAVHAQLRLRWRLASTSPKAQDLLTGAGETFARRVNDLSRGRFSVAVQPAGEPYATSADALEAVRSGSIEAVHVATHTLVAKDECYALGSSLPFGLNARQLNAWLIDGNGLTLMREFHRANGLVNFPGGNVGAQMAGWSRREIKSAADVRGLRVAIDGLAATVWQRLGAEPQTVGAGDHVAALEKGTADCAMPLGGPYDDAKQGLNRVAPHYLYPGWWGGGPQLDFLVHARVYDALSADYKLIVESAAATAHAEVQARYDARNPVALKRLVGSGTKLARLPKEVMDLAFKECTALYADISAKNPAWKRIYESLGPFRRDQNLWFRFAEAGFDDFMQAQRL